MIQLRTIGDNGSISGPTYDSQVIQQTNENIAWTGFHYNFFSNNEYEKFDSLLDSDSTNTIFCNKNYVKNVRPSN